MISKSFKASKSTAKVNSKLQPLARAPRKTAEAQSAHSLTRKTAEAYFDDLFFFGQFDGLFFLGEDIEKDRLIPEVKYFPANFKNIGCDRATIVRITDKAMEKYADGRLEAYEAEMKNAFIIQLHQNKPDYLPMLSCYVNKVILDSLNKRLGKKINTFTISGFNICNKTNLSAKKLQDGEENILGVASRLIGQQDGSVEELGDDVPLLSAITDIVKQRADITNEEIAKPRAIKMIQTLYFLQTAKVVLAEASKGYDLFAEVVIDQGKLKDPMLSGAAAGAEAQAKDVQFTQGPENCADKAAAEEAEAGSEDAEDDDDPFTEGPENCAARAAVVASAEKRLVEATEGYDDHFNPFEGYDDHFNPFEGDDDPFTEGPENFAAQAEVEAEAEAAAAEAVVQAEADAEGVVQVEADAEVEAEAEAATEEAEVEEAVAEAEVQAATEEAEGEEADAEAEVQVEADAEAVVQVEEADAEAEVEAGSQAEGEEADSSNVSWLNRLLILIKEFFSFFFNCGDNTPSDQEGDTVISVESKAVTSGSFCPSDAASATPRSATQDLASPYAGEGACPGVA